MSEIEPKTLTLKEGSDGIFKCHSESPVHWFHVQENYPFNPEEKSLNDYSEYSNIQKTPLKPNGLVCRIFVIIFFIFAMLQSHSQQTNENSLFSKILFVEFFYSTNF